MTQLTIYQESSAQTPIYQATEEKAIATALAQVGVGFERWQANQPIADDASNEEILAVYQTEIDRLIAETGYQTYDVISMYPEHPQKETFRQKFLAEHTHSDAEIRFFNRGKGMFTLHIEDKVYEIICEKNDLINVPANTRHWFDMGENPSFTCIRLFDNPEGWVANFTGSDIAEKFSRL
jgi:1,2-dihydroxy-3-keto-5-methylthiopentene dioxygenase